MIRRRLDQALAWANVQMMLPDRIRWIDLVGALMLLPFLAYTSVGWPPHRWQDYGLILAMIAFLILLAVLAMRKLRAG
jgi:hypothetical protein